jgi:hypothetical protein
MTDADEATVDRVPGDDPEGSAEKRAERAARSLGKTLNGLLFAILRVTPFGGRFWRLLAVKGLENYWKRSGADRIGLEKRPNGKVALTPVKWRPPGELELDERGGWKAKGRDKTWEPVAEGQTGARLGRTPIVPLDSESWRDSSWAEASIAEAVDLGETRPVYNVSEAVLSAEVEMTGQPNGARADGGAAVSNVQFEPRQSPIFEDTIIDIASGEGFDGRAVSFGKVKEMYAEHTTTDEMAAQEDRGYLAGMSKQDMKSMLVKLMLIAGLIALGGLIGPELVAALFGGGAGGGGGSMIPFTLGVV